MFFRLKKNRSPCRAASSFVQCFNWALNIFALRSLNFFRLNLAISLLVISPLINAAEWWLSPSIKLGENYDDNILLTTAAHSSVRNTAVSPQLDFGVTSDIWQVGGEAKLTRRRFA